MSERTTSAPPPTKLQDLKATGAVLEPKHDVACPACQNAGWLAGEGNSERRTVYWCLAELCQVRSFVI
jgi:hypothetical protein